MRWLIDPINPTLLHRIEQGRILFTAERMAVKLHVAPIDKITVTLMTCNVSDADTHTHTYTS